MKKSKSSISLPAPDSAKDIPSLAGLHTPELYLNRELSWLEFNQRVMHEAEDVRTPLLERVKFLAIVSNDLDEFFMKRLGGLKKLFAAGIKSLTVDGRTPQQQIKECHAVIRGMEHRKQGILSELRILLQEAGIAIVSHDSLTPRERKCLRDRFFDNIYPLITPQAIDPAHPFPFISNLSLNLMVTLRSPSEREQKLARVKVPVGTGIPRFLRVGDKDRFIPLEELLRHNLDLVFPEMDVIACELFRVTRNANTERSEEQADDLMALIESELQPAFRPHRPAGDRRRDRPGPPRDARRGAGAGRGGRRIRGGGDACHGQPV